MTASLTIRKLADKTTGERVTRYDQETGAKKLVNPATDGDDHEPWPLAGVEAVGEVPAEVDFPTHFVARGKAEGWITLEGEEVVHRPGGPPDNVWAVTHTMVQAQEIVLHLASGDVRYKVVHQPDKYVAEGTDKTKVSDELYAAGQTRVDYFYGCKLVGKKD